MKTLFYVIAKMFESLIICWSAPMDLSANIIVCYISLICVYLLVFQALMPLS